MVSINDVYNLSLEIPSSAFVPSTSSRSIDSKWGSANKKGMENSCELQRVVASEAFSSSTRKRFDNGMVLSDSDIQNETETLGACGDRTSCSLWFGCSLSFLEVPTFQKAKVLQNSNGKPELLDNDENAPHQLGFIQQFDVFNDYVLPIDKIDKKLNCVRLG